MIKIPLVATLREHAGRIGRNGMIVGALGFLSVALQRFGFTRADGSSFQLVTLVLVATVAWVLIRVRMAVGYRGVILFSLLVLTVAVSTIVSGIRGGLVTSNMSLAFLVVTYTVMLTSGGWRENGNPGRRFFAGAVFAIRLGAVTAIVQFVVQSAGGGYLDPLKGISSTWLRTGFNNYYQISGTDHYKPNGVIFLEPSFLSLYAALALVDVVGRTFRANRASAVVQGSIWTGILAAGLAVSASTSGLVVLAVAAVPLALTIRKNRYVLSTLAVLAVGTVVALWAGVFTSVIAKATEGFSIGTSSGLRLQLPYQLLAPYWLERPIFGWGPGAASSAVKQIAVPGLQESTVMKLLVEYGLLGAVVIALCVWVAVRRSGAPAYLIAAILAAWLIPTESLLNSTLVLMVLFVVPNWCTNLDPPRGPRWYDGYAPAIAKWGSKPASASRAVPLRDAGRGELRVRR